MEEFKFYVTDSAILALKKSLNNCSCVRVGVKGAGCSGFSYLISINDSLKNTDCIFTFGDLQILIDKKSILYLNGTTLDYEKTLQKQDFVFKNPNAKSLCGCGRSFSA